MAKIKTAEQLFQEHCTATGTAYLSDQTKKVMRAMFFGGFQAAFKEVRDSAERMDGPEEVETMVAGFMEEIQTFKKNMNK